MRFKTLFLYLSERWGFLIRNYTTSIKKVEKDVSPI
jgi:hypothetical protein